MGSRLTISTAFGCPFEGAVSVEAVVRVANALAEFRRLTRYRSAIRSGSRRASRSL